MTTTEDCASVLDQFIYDAANLPAEIMHMMDEIQAKDTELQKYQSAINSRDGQIQKTIKASGVLEKHPKETEYSEQVKKNYEQIYDLQSQKVALSEKASTLLDQQLRKLDTAIRHLQSDGQLADAPLPSIFNRKAEQPKALMEIPTSLPLNPASFSALNASAHRMNAQMAALHTERLRQQVQNTALNNASQRSSVPASPASIVQQQHNQKQRERESSLGAENKRRKLGNPLAGINLPAQPSSLRQSSLGPGTPKAGTPTGTAVSRAGSVPRTSAAPQQGNAALKKSTLSHKVMNQQVTKLKNKHTKHARLSSAGRKKAGSPSVRGGRAGTATSEGDDSVLSSADASETDASQSRARRGQKKRKEKENADVEMVDEEEHEDEDENRYCFCNEKSYGEMVGCENDDCKYQWFHTGCLHMKKVPEEDEVWYCPECREKPDIKVKIEKLNKKSGRKA